MSAPTRIVCLAVVLLGLASSTADAWPRHRAHPSRAPARLLPHIVAAGTIRVHDGDTFYVGPETIRLRGIDTPELGQPRSRLATDRLTALLREGPVTIVPRVEDVYGRTVADVYVNGHDIAYIMRKEGFAKPPAR